MTTATATAKKPRNTKKLPAPENGVASVASLDDRRPSEGLPLAPLPVGFVADMPVDAIDPDPDNRPANLDPDFIESIRELGVLQPILVRPVPGNGVRWRIVAGERRYRATIHLGLTTIPAVVQDLDDHQAVIAQAVENLRRRDLTPAEEILAISRCAALGITISDLARKIGSSEKWVGLRLKIVTLPPRYLTALDAGEITWELAEKAARLQPATLERTTPKRHDIERALDHESNQRKLEKALAAHRKKHHRIVEKEAPTTKRLWMLGLNADDTDAHQTESCHGHLVTLATWGGVIDEAVCVDPDRHKKDGASKLKTTRTPTALSTTDQRRRERSESMLAWAREFMTRYQVSDVDRAMLLQRTIRGVIYQSDIYDAALKYTTIDRKSCKTINEKISALEDFAVTKSTPAWIALVLFLCAVVQGYTSGEPQYDWAIAHGWTDPHPSTKTKTELCKSCTTCARPIPSTGKNTCDDCQLAAVTNEAEQLCDGDDPA
jgi:ParB/RepB/Spo0J family partition protein